MWKYRKKIQLNRWLRINISTSGLSITIGQKGFSINIGKNGIFLNTSIPGTGLYDRKKIISFNFLDNQQQELDSTENEIDETLKQVFGEK